MNTKKPTSVQLAEWMCDRGVQMLVRQDAAEFYKELGKFGDTEVSVKLQWEPGYAPDATDIYSATTDYDTYHLTVGLFETDSSYMVSDWTPLSETCSMSADYLGIACWLLEQLDRIAKGEILLEV